MPAPAMVQRPIQMALKVLSWLAFLAPLAARIVIGHGFYQAGHGKLENISKPIMFFTNLGIPFPELNAHFVSRLEMYGGVLLMLGFLTRPMAFLLSGTMVVALLTAHGEEFWKNLGEPGNLVDVAPMPYLLCLLWLLFHGAGFLSVDRLFHGWLGLGKPAQAPAAPGAAGQGSTAGAGIRT